jgi:hypothetical protein
MRKTTVRGPQAGLLRRARHNAADRVPSGARIAVPVLSTMAERVMAERVMAERVMAGH